MQRQRLREKIREKKAQRGGTNNTNVISPESVVLSLAGEDPDMLRLAHSLLKKPEMAVSMLQNIKPSAKEKGRERSEEEEGIPKMFDKEEEEEEGIPKMFDKEEEEKEGVPKLFDNEGVQPHL